MNRSAISPKNALLLAIFQGNSLISPFFLGNISQGILPDRESICIRPPNSSRNGFQKCIGNCGNGS
jgi:hypothetical protein